MTVHACVHVWACAKAQRIYILGHCDNNNNNWTIKHALSQTVYATIRLDSNIIIEDSGIQLRRKNNSMSVGQDRLGNHSWAGGKSPVRWKGEDVWNAV